MTNEDFFRRVRNCGLKHKTGNVWQTLNEQDCYSVRPPSEMDEDEKRSFLRELREQLGLPPAEDET